MHNSFLENYFDLNGEVQERTPIDQVCVKLFAGFKFVTDRLISLIGLVVLGPLMLLIAVLIKLDSKGPILFKQLRTGKYGKNFYMLKFRTMEANNDGHDFSKADQHTRIGKILRKTSLDELPQLINLGYSF